MIDRFGFSDGAVYRIRLILLATMLLLSTLSVSSCDLTGGLGGHIESSIDKALEVIDNGIRDIERDSGSWQTILQRVANQLPQEISETVRVDAQSLATRSIATAGIEFRCNVDFLASRAIESLRRLKAELLNQNPPPLPPAFCLVDPASIDLKVSPTKWSTVILYGYDVDHKDSAGKPLQVLLLTSQGGTIPLPESRIGRTTHYQITLNLGGMARQLYRDRITKIVMSWSDKSEGYPQIVVIPWEARRQTNTVSIGNTGPYYPPCTHGDRDFDTGDDDPTYLEVRGEIRITEQTIDNRMYMYAREAKPDNTEVNGWSQWARAYTAPNGWRIVEVRPNVASRHTASVTVHGRIAYHRPAGEVVEYFEVWVDQDGDEAGTWSRIITHWRPLNIKIEEVTPEWLR